MSTQQIEAKFQSMGKDDLMRYIENKGNERKMAMHRITQLQTNDWHNTSSQKRKMIEQKNRLLQEQRDWLNQQAQNDQAAQVEVQQIREIENNLNAKIAQLDLDKNEGVKSRPLKDEIIQHTRLVQKDIVVKINKIFEEENPEHLSNMLESFVALLRNKKSKAVDVQLFFQDHAKLTSKMTKLETTAVSLELVEEIEPKLQGMQLNRQQGPRPTKSDDCSFATPFLNWSIAFCKAAKIDLKIKKVEKEISDLRLELERAKLKVERFTKIKQDNQNLGFAQYYDEAIQSLEQRIHVMENICQTDLDQATDYQKKYKNFENAYFEKYLAIVQEMQNDDNY